MPLMVLKISLKRKGEVVVKKLKEGSAAEERTESPAYEKKEDAPKGGQDSAFPGQGAVKNPHIHGSQSKSPSKRPN